MKLLIPAEFPGRDKVTIQLLPGQAGPDHLNGDAVLLKDRVVKRAIAHLPGVDQLLAERADLQPVQYIKLAMAECGLGSEMVRAPRLPLAGPERAEILGIIRYAIQTRP